MGLWIVLRSKFKQLVEVFILAVDHAIDANIWGVIAQHLHIAHAHIGLMDARDAKGFHSIGVHGQNAQVILQGRLAKGSRDGEHLLIDEQPRLVDGRDARATHRLTVAVNRVVIRAIEQDRDIGVQRVEFGQAERLLILPLVLIPPHTDEPSFGVDG